MDLQRPRFFPIRLVAFACAIVLLATATNASRAWPTSTGGQDATPKKKAVHHKMAHKKYHHGLHKRDAATRLPAPKLNMPPPGHDGEEISDWFMRRRAWPNGTIDPEAYPRALAEAARMPVLEPRSGKNGILSASAWQSIGPYSIDGRISCIATHPTDSNIFYVGAAAGGLWKTTDHGTSWRCVTDTFGMLPTGSVTIDPVQPETIYLGMGEPNQSGDSYPGNGLWKSTDGGSTWMSLGFAKSQYIAKILIDRNNHNNLFVAIPGPNGQADSNRGVFRSTDGGLSWTRSLFVRLPSKSHADTTVGFIDIAINPLNSGELVAFAWDHTLPLAPGFSGGSTGPNTGVYRTVDTGNTWSRIDTVAGTGLPNGTRMKVLGRGALLWTTLASKREKSILFAAYTRADTNLLTHYRTDENFEGLYSSFDEGVTWSKILDSTVRIPMGGVQGKDSANITNAQGGYNFYLAENPPVTGSSPTNDIYLGGIDVFRWGPEGQWTDITKSYSQYYVKANRQQHSDQHGLAFSAASSHSDMIVVSDGGVFHTDDFGTSWNQLTGLPITMFYAIEPWKGGMINTPSTITANDLKVFGGTQDNGTVAYGLTKDTNFAWINHGDGGVSVSHPTDSNKIITSLQLGVIFGRNLLDSLIPNPLGMRDTTHDTRPRWHTLSYKLLKGAHALTDSAESCAFIAPVVLDEQKPTDLYTGRCHVYHAVIDWNDLENTKWYRWSPILAGNLSNDSVWYYGDIETIATGVHDAAGHPMLWAGGYNYYNGLTELWRTTVDPSRGDTVAPHWLRKTTGLPAANISAIVADRSDSLTAFCANSSAQKIGHVFSTSDGGAHWKSITGNLPATPVSALVIDTFPEHGNPQMKNQVLIVATDVGVYVTTNGGSSWSALGTGMPHIIVSDLKIYKNMLIAATHGRSLYAIDISDVQAESRGVAAQIPLASARLEVYPNPAMSASGFHLKLLGAFAAATSCRIIEESTGKSITEHLTNDGEGSYHIANPDIDLPSGAYILQLLNGEQVLAQSRVSIVR